MPTDLNTALVDLIGGRTAKAFEQAFEMRTVGDLLRHYPRRIVQRGELTDLGSLRIDDEVTVLAEVKRAVVHESRNPKVRYQSYHGKPKSRLEVHVGDGHGTVQLVFFRQAHYHAARLLPGTLGLFSGKVGLFNKQRQLAHPEYHILSRDDELAEHEADVFANELIPVYPANKDVATWTISRAIEVVLAHLDPLEDPVPAQIRLRQGLVSFDDAIRAVHTPADWAEYQRARKRLKWDEALAVQLALAQRRALIGLNPAVARPVKPGGLLTAFDERLPFVLTKGQVEIGHTLATELADAHPMHRLLQGEVGSGKTVVALRAMLQVVDAGGQAALLAPTEVLAHQHARTIETMLGPLAQAGRLGGSEHATRVALLTGSLPAAARKAALLDAASGAAGIVVGTHALIQDKVSFAELGLVVVDEQHRFGVEQRDALRSKAEQPPHLLVMTATPIPRTVAMTVFGDLDTSTLVELPAGRMTIETAVVPVAERPAWLDRAWERVREEVAAGRQAYVVCPRIGPDLAEYEAELAEIELPDDEFPSRRPPVAVTDLIARLADGPLRGLRLAVLHGRLTPDERDATMSDFTAGRIDVLVATTVIEVGVDVANATVMVVVDADRFGISQLHQLRGRIGRGAAKSVCLLVTDVPEGAPSRERLDAVAGTTDGFALAELDVEMRREGDVLGTAQSGSRRQLRLLSLLRDRELIGSARDEATELIRTDRRLLKHRLLAREVAALVGEEQAEFLDKA